MKWKALTTEDQFKDILEKSFHTAQLIYKHSIACGVSGLIKYRLEKNTPPDNMDFYFLDIFRFRSLSNKISDHLHIPHESPQILLIKNAHCVYNESHMGINMANIKAHNMAA